MQLWPKFCLYLIGSLLVQGIVFAQCGEKNKAYQEGEEISYEVAYNLGFIWINAGKASFKVEGSNFNQAEVYRFFAYGTTLEKWDWIYKVRDTYEVYMDPHHLRPLKFYRNTSEGRNHVNNVYYFDYLQAKIYTTTKNSEKQQSRDTIHLPSCTMDVLSMIYRARNIDYTQYQKNDKIPISLIIDGKVYELYIRYLGKEVIKTRDRKRYRCFKFKPLLVEGTLFSSGENMTVWVTDDDNKIPILIEAKILVGSVKAILTDAKGLKNKIGALVKK